MTQLRRRGSLVVASALFVGPLLASALVGWAVMGDLSEPGGDQPILSIQASAGFTALIGIAGAVIAVGVLGWLWGLHRHAALAPGAFSVVLPAVALGGLTAFGLRLLSARTVGANIGGGMISLFGPIIALVLIVWAWSSWRSFVTEGGA